MSARGSQPLPRDTHALQARRVADYSENHPGQFFTGDELTTACDLGGCASKVLSMMDREFRYDLAKGWRPVARAGGACASRVRTYRVVHRPRGEERDLFDDASDIA